MLRKVQKRLEELGIGQLHKEEQRLIMALSGGADSVCLLRILRELQEPMGFSLEAIHVEHGIRGEESRGDARFVKALCESWQVPCHVENIDVPAYSKVNGLGIEEAARVLRYQIFSNYAKRRNGYIVLAHHMDDNAETVLFQMIRGSALSGMCGISARRLDEAGVVYVRPMLGISREEIESYLKDIGQTYRTDSTNLETEYDRNYIRQEIMPRLTKINSSAVSHISQTALGLDEIRDYMQSETQKAMARLLEEAAEGMTLDINLLKELHPALQKEIIYQTLAKALGSRKDIGAVHVEEIRNLMWGQSGRRLSLPRQIVVKKEYDKLIFFTEKEQGLSRKPKQKPVVEIKEDELLRWREADKPIELSLGISKEKLVLRFFPNKGNLEKIPQKTYTKWLDYDKIRSGFCIRTRQSGDFFISDASGHKKKLKTYFIDEKIPSGKRESMWLLAQNEVVLWLIGGRISEHVKISEETSTILEIQYIGGK